MRAGYRRAFFGADAFHRINTPTQRAAGYGGLQFMKNVAELDKNMAVMTRVDNETLVWRSAREQPFRLVGGTVRPVRARPVP